MGKETSNRIQTSLLNAMEKKVLIWMAERQPLWMTSDTLTYIGLLGAVICGLGFALAHIDKIIYGFHHWGWLSIGMATALMERWHAYVTRSVPFTDSLSIIRWMR